MEFILTIIFIILLITFICLLAYFNISNYKILETLKEYNEKYLSKKIVVSSHATNEEIGESVIYYLSNYDHVLLVKGDDFNE